MLLILPDSILLADDVRLIPAFCMQSLLQCTAAVSASLPQLHSGQTQTNVLAYTPVTFRHTLMDLIYVIPPTLL